MPAPPASRAWYQNPRLILSLLFILVTYSYANSVFSPLVLDDYNTFINTSHLSLTDLTPSSLLGLTHSRFGLFRFIPILSLALNNYASGGRIADYHITNIAIHLITLAVLYLFLKRLTRIPRVREQIKFIPVPLFIITICGLWALNPLQTNAVTYIVQRMTSLATLFYLASLTLYLSGRQAGTMKKRMASYTGALLAAMGAFMSKENSATIPIAILLLEWLFNPGIGQRLKNKITRRRCLIVAIVIIILMPLAEKPWHELIINGYDNRHFTLIERLLTESRVIVQYISLLLLPLPSRLNLDHDVTVSQSLLHPPSTILAMVFLTAIIVYAWKKRTAMPLFTFGVLWFFLNLVIESTVIPLELMFEHRLYLPSIGFFIAIIAAIDHVAYIMIETRSKDKKRKTDSVIALAIIIFFSLSSVLTTLRNATWRNNLILYSDMVKKSPNKARTLITYGKELVAHGEYKKGIKWLEKGIKACRPNYEYYYAAADSIFLAYQHTHSDSHAIKKIKSLLYNAPSWAKSEHIQEIYHNTAVVYLDLGDQLTAFRAARAALLLLQADRNDKTVLFAAYLLNKAYDHKETRHALGMSDKPRKTAVLARLTGLLVEVRDYDKAETYRKILSKIDYNVGEEAERKISAAKNKNQRAANRLSLARDKDYISNSGFRINMKIADFIMDWYRPLLAVVPYFLDQAAMSAPTNPFVDLYRIKLLQLDDAPKEKIAGSINKVLKKRPGNPVFLPVAFNFYRKNDRRKACVLAKKLFVIYPAIPGWRNIQVFLDKTDGKFTLPKARGKTIHHVQPS